MQVQTQLVKYWLKWPFRTSETPAIPIRCQQYEEQGTWDLVDVAHSSIGDDMFGPIVHMLEERRIAVAQARVTGYLLDVGCGPNKLVRRYKNGVGVDIHEWGDVDYIIKDASNLPFETASFDTVSFIACLNHISNRQEALIEAWRVLKPNGLLLVTMIGPRISRLWHSLVAQDDPDQVERGHLDEGEVWGITNREMRRLLDLASFRFKERKRFILGLNNLYIAEKVSENA